MSTRRRANGEGSIYRRNSTGQWVAAITISGGHGTPPGKKTRTARTRAEANRLLRQLQAEIDEGPPLDDNRITVADWCHQWCDTIAPQNASPATVSDYYWTLDHYVWRVDRPGRTVPLQGEPPRGERWLVRTAPKPANRF